MANEVSARDLSEFQHWKDIGLAERGFVRWGELRTAASRLFHSDAPKPGDPNAQRRYLLSYDDVQEAHVHPDTYSNAQYQVSPEVQMDGVPMSDGDVTATALVLLCAALDTVVAQLSHTFSHLAGDAGLCDRIRSEPGSISKIIDEMMRYYTIAISARTLTEDTELAGCPVHAGDRKVMPLASTNRHPQIFVGSDRLTPTVRAVFVILALAPAYRVAFWVHLARLEMRIALEEWHKRISRLRN